MENLDGLVLVVVESSLKSGGNYYMETKYANLEKEDIMYIQQGLLNFNEEETTNEEVIDNIENQEEFEEIPNFVV